MQVPQFSEKNHPLVRSLAQQSDGELLTRLQREPQQGRYFVALFCRYDSMVYTLIWHHTRSPVQAEYLFAVTWRSIFQQLPSLNLPADSASGRSPFSLQTWLINEAAACINAVEPLAAEQINYSLAAASPPLWCYVQAALEQLSPPLRLMVLLTYTFRWSPDQIVAHLQAEGETRSIAEVLAWLEEGGRQLVAALPADIRAIYLGEALYQHLAAGSESEI